MDDAVQRFRRQAGRELGDRQGAERRYLGRAAATSGRVLAGASADGRRGARGGDGPRRRAGEPASVGPRFAVPPGARHCRCGPRAAAPRRGH